MEIRFKLNWKTILTLLGAAIFGWFVRHFLDKWKTFEFLEKQYNHYDVTGKVIGLLGTSVTILDILTFLVLTIIGYILINWLYNKFFGKAARVRSNFKKLQAFNSKTIDHINFKWHVGIRNGRPSIENLIPYCANHEIAIPMIYDQPLEMYRCQSCDNTLTKPFIPQMGAYGNDYQRYKAILQGELENRWEQINV